MTSSLLRSVPLFLIAGLLEIGGGYLIWMWLRQGRHIGIALLGAVLLAMYGVAATYQPAEFGRVYAAYGGVFIALSLLWAWGIDKRRPDVPDLAGAALCLIGAAIIMYWPRGRGA
jgi:small multidrug resistance family-3 protein